MHYQHILLPVDGSEVSQKAEKECVAFAKSIGAKVTAIHVISHFHLHYQPWAATRSVHEKIEHEHEAEAKKIAEKMLSELQARIKAQGVECDGLVVIGDHPYEEIIETATQRNCDLILMASHGRRGLDAVLLGSETVKVLTHSRIPVLVVR